MKYGWLVVLLLAVSAQVHAQELTAPAARQGYYLGGGLYGGALLVYGSDAKEIGAASGGGMSLQLGQLVTSWLGLGLQVMYSSAKSGTWNIGQPALMVASQFIPIDNLALHLGVGFAALQAREPSDKNEDPRGSYGGAFDVGVSYDFFPFYKSGSGGFGIAPAFHVIMFPERGLASAGVWAGVEMHYWTGLPANRLQ